MKELRPDPTTRDVAAAPERCYAVLDAVEAYPDWLTGVEAVEPLERDDEGRVVTARVTVRLELAVMRRSITFTAGVEREPPHRVTLRRVKTAGGGDERLVLDWTIAPRGEGSHVRLAVEAAFDLPRFAPVGGAADGLVRDFADAFARRADA